MAGLGVGYVDGIPFVKVLGHSPRAGERGTLFTYTAYVERGIDVGPLKFARIVREILADERGWIRGGKVSFQRVESGAGTQLVLASPSTVDKLCYPLNTEGEVSCCQGTKVVLNVDRWKNAVPHWTESLEAYRRMVVNHEFGHRTGHGHGFCPGAGKRAPVMQQQTYGLQGCRENSWPLDSEL